MPFTETVTIINNSGKILSTGKQLVNIFKDAKAAYRDKKDALRAERAGIQRARTFEMTPRGPPPEEYYEYDGYENEIDRRYDRRALRDDVGRRRSHDDRSQASSRHSHRSKRSHQHRSSSRARSALTESNLRTHSEVSSTTPSAAPKGYRSPYAETMPRDLTLSRPTLAHAASSPYPTRSEYPGPAPVPVPVPVPVPMPASNATTPVSTPRQSMMVHRPRSDTALNKTNAIDMDLAYGDIPPDLESRVDLDTAEEEAPEAAAAPDVPPEAEALSLVDRIEAFLEEAQCVHHSASAIIENLQERPEAAAAVALTLAELSALLGKMSPAFLSVIKGGSPAIFALLASPQFLIGAGVAVGVTVVMFGGWKIVKRISEGRKEKEQPIAMQAQPAVPTEPVPVPPPPGGQVPQPAGSAVYEEALVLEEELSTIESWRRGITPFGEDETADIELMSPEAERVMRERHHDEELHPDDSASGIGYARTVRSARTHRSSKTHRSRRHDDRDADDVTIPERKSSKPYKDRAGESEVARSERSHRSHRSSQSKRTERTSLKAIEDGSKEKDNTLESVLHKEKKPNMLKTLFKKKEKEAKERTAISVLV